MNTNPQPTFQDLVNLLHQNEQKEEKRREEMAQEEKKRREESAIREKRLDKKMEEMIEVYKKAGLIQGKSAEESVYKSVSKLFAQRGKEFNKVEKNIRVKKDGKPFAEYDIIAVNGSEVMPIEVKNNLTTDDIEHFVKIQIPKFRESFPEYKNYQLLGGVGGLVVSESTENYAKKNGLYVFVQNGKNMSLANEKDFKAKVFV